MTAVLVEPAESEDELIGRCYTKARRTPLVVGSVPGGGGRSLRLPGGPYTLTQLAAIVATFVVLILSRPLWGGRGLMDVVVLLGCPFGVAFLLRHLHIDGRNPAAAAASVAVMMTGPRWGRLHGRPFRPARPARGATRITVAAADAAEPSAASAAPARTAPTRAARRPIPAAPASSAAANSPVASGVQALLARRSASARDDLEE
ncbi:hypothetical protein OG883_41645 [Streptomyces sp. NBC_01142]|uniref:hypothetical protein n=1 Tax=Streptomyces sp. NBC_01142 TaxID=2975865 RepID=UPI0022527C55|nr:hypothetical protein [Streptomyces sp. NBC_01142]MCX4826176.1 hypothetical protein [Streptomyces sp. NBC_01142]